MVFNIRTSQEINKIRDGTPLEAEEILTYRKKPRNGLVWHFSSKLDVPSNICYRRKEWHGFYFLKFGHLKKFSKYVMKKRVAWILVFKIRPSQEILKIRDGTHSEAKEIFIYRKSPRNGPSQEILKIRDGTPSEAEEILTYRKSPEMDRFGTFLASQMSLVMYYRIKEWHIFWFSKLGHLKKFSKFVMVPLRSKVLQKKRVARIVVFNIRTSQKINKIRDGTPLEAEEILTYRKKPRNGLVWHFSSKLDVPSNMLQKKRVGQVLFFKIWPSQEILKIRYGTPLEKKRVARILVFKIRPSQEILKIRDGTPSEAEEIFTYRKSPKNGSVWYFSSKLDVHSNVLQKKRVARILFSKSGHLKKFSKFVMLDVPSNVLQKKRVAQILVFKIRPSQEILKIRDGTPSEAEEILTYRKKPRNGSIWHFSSKSDVPSNVLQKKRLAWILFFKIWPSQEIFKIRYGTHLEAEEILTYRKKPSKWIENGSVWYFSSKLDVPSKVLQKKRVARIMVFKIRPSQEILKIRDGTHSEAKEILIYRKSPRNGSVWHFSSKLDVPSNVLQKKRVARILVFKIRPSQEILKIRDGTHSEAKEILIYRKSPRNGSVWHFSSKLDVPSNVLHKKRVARILVFKIRPSQEILKIRDGTPSEAEEILTYRKKPRNGSISHFSSKSDVPSNVLQKKRVARILVFKIRPSQEILKIRDGTPSEAEEILTYRKKP
ncbi:hypothetical protein OROMI_012946 [Orobanche minor]